MDSLVRGWSLSLVLLQWAWQCNCLKVKFQSSKPLYVALSRTLVLEAQIDPNDPKMMVTWERVKDGKRSRLFPSYTEVPRVSVENKNRTLRVTNFSKEDCGTYTITVRQNGGEEFDSRTVFENKVAPEVSIPLLCEVSHDLEQWDTPTFTWLKDGEELSETTANLSSDGRRLYPSEACVHNYTCVVNSSLGTSSRHFYHTGCGTNPEDGCTGPKAAAGFLAIVVLLLLAAILYIKRDSVSRCGRMNDHVPTMTHEMTE